MAKNILVVVDMQTAEAQKAAAALAGEVKSLGEALSDQSEEVHKFRSGIDDAVEQLNIFGDAGAALVGEINKISDPMKRLAVANEIIASTSTKAAQDQRDLQDAFNSARVKAIAAAGGVEQYEAKLADMKDSLDAIRDPQRRAALEMELAGKGTNRLGAFTQNLSDTFHTQRARLISAVGGLQNYTMLLGAAGVAAGVLVGIVGGTLALAYDRASKGLEAYIAKNKEAQRLQEFTAGAANANAEKLGGAVYKLSSDFDIAEAEATSFFDNYLAHALLVLQGTRTYSEAMQDVYGVKLPALAKGPLDLFGGISSGIINNTIHIDKFAKALDLVSGRIKDSKTSVDVFTGSLSGQKVALEQLNVSLSTYGGLLDDAAKKAASATPYLDALSGKELSGQSGSTAAPITAALSRSGGGGARVQPASGGAFGDIFSGIGDTLSGFGGRAVEQGQSDVARFQSIQDVSNRMKAAKEEFKAGNEAADQAIALQRQQEQIKLNEEQAASFQFVAGSVTNFAGAFVQASTQIAAAMAGQGGAWKAWQAAGLSAVSSLASTFGDFFLTWGTANVAINPGLAAIAIAGGLALKGIAGATAGAADRIGAKDTKKATTAVRAAEPVSSGRDQGRDTPIILEMDGARLAHTVSKYLARAARDGILTLRPST